MSGTSPGRLGAAAGAIALITLLAYLPALRAGFVWDDDVHVTDNPAVRSGDGLRRIWFEPGVVLRHYPQYYPLVSTSFWLEYRLWGARPFGYHLVNVLLHALNALLLWRILDRLRVPGAWLAAAIFALHPVHVESVAWISERKNTLSGAFYLAALLAYLRFDPLDGAAGAPRRDWRFYPLLFGLFACALLSKTVTASLPAVVLLLVWWKRGRIEGRDVAVLAPLFALGAALGLATVWLEKTQVGAVGEEWALSLPERCLIAGRALWFYVGKLAWPRQLTFIYPRWRIDATAAWAWAFPLAAIAVLLALSVARRRIGRAPLVAALVFTGTLVPALGFFDVYPMRYTFVADHYQYLASAAVIACAAAGVTTASRRLGPVAPYAWAALLALLGALAWQRTLVYRDMETLWRDTLAKDPASWMAHNNLGMELVRQGRLDEGIGHFEEGLRHKPGYAKLHNNLGMAFIRQGRLEEATRELSQALRLNPDYPEAHNNLGVTLAKQGRSEEAVAHFREAARLKPDYVEAHYNAGHTLATAGQLAAAAPHLIEALRLKPDFAEAHYDLGVVWANQGRVEDAVRELETAVALRPDYAPAARALAELRRRGTAGPSA